MSLSCIKNQKGSTAVLMLTVIPLLLLIILCFTFTGYFIQMKSQVRSICIQQSIQIQKNIIQSEKKLFALNPLSTMLRLRLLKAKADLAVAISTYNPGAAARAIYDIESIENQQRQLDRLQKGLIKAAEIQASFATQNLILKISQHLYQMSSIWQFYLSILNTLRVTHHPEVAVKPDFEDTAPNYELKTDYKTRQQVVLFWQHLFTTKDQAQKLIHSTTEFEFSCGAGPNKKANEWHIEIKGDRF